MFFPVRAPPPHDPTCLNGKVDFCVIVFEFLHSIIKRQKRHNDDVKASGVLDLFAGVSRKSDGWVGLGCCELAISAECRRECRQVRHRRKNNTCASTFLLICEFWLDTNSCFHPPRLQASSKNDITKVCKKVTEVRLQMFNYYLKTCLGATLWLTSRMTANRGLSLTVSELSVRLHHQE